MTLSDAQRSISRDCAEIGRLAAQLSAKDWADVLSLVQALLEWDLHHDIGGEQ